MEKEKTIRKVINLNNVTKEELLAIKNMVFSSKQKPLKKIKNKNLAKSLKKLKEVKSHIRFSSIKWAYDNEKNNIYGSIPIFTLWNLVTKKDLDRIYLINYNGKDLRFINCNKIQPEGIYKIEDKDKFLELFPTNIINDNLNKDFIPVINEFLKIISIFPENGSVEINNNKLEFYDYIYK